MVFNAFFSTLLHLYCGIQCTYPCFSGVLLTSSPYNILSKPLAAFHITIVETTDSSERGINPVAMTIINPWKEYLPSQGSNQRPPVLKSATLQTELWGLAQRVNASAKSIICLRSPPRLTFVKTQSIPRMSKDQFTSVGYWSK